MSNSDPLLTGNLAAFVAAYKQCRKVQQAEAESGYHLHTAPMPYAKGSTDSGPDL